MLYYKPLNEVGDFMGYLSIGSGFISSDLFLKIKNTDGIKPTGGIWATNYDLKYENYNEWVDYLCANPYILYYQNVENPHKLSATHIILKEDANIFMLDSLEKIMFLKEKYPYNGWVDFEKMALFYDGIYVDIHKIMDIKDELSYMIAKAFSVSTLLLFNPYSIKYYQKASVDLSNIDFNNRYEFGEYTITLENKLLQVQDTSLDVQILIEIIKRYIIKNNIQINGENIEKIKKIFQGSINEALKYQNIPQKDSLLVRKVFNQF